MHNVIKYIVLWTAVIHTLGYSMGIVLLNDMLSHRHEYVVPGSSVMSTLDTLHYTFIVLALTNACGIVGLINTRGDQTHPRCLRFQLWNTIFKYYVVGSGIEMFMPILAMIWANVSVSKYGSERVFRAACLQVPGFDVWFRWDVDECSNALGRLQRLDGVFATTFFVLFFIKFALAAISWYMWDRHHIRKGLFIDTSASLLAKEEPIGSSASPTSFGTPTSLSDVRFGYDSPLGSPSTDALPYSPKRRGSRVFSLREALPRLATSPTENPEVLPTHNEPAGTRYRCSSWNNGSPVFMQEGSGLPSTPRFVTRTRRSMSMPNASIAVPRVRPASRDLPDLDENAQ